MPQVSFEDIIVAITQDSRPIVFVDTCAYLDIIRLFPREDSDTSIFQAGKALVNNLLSAHSSFWLVTANIVEKEWNDHATEVLAESDRWFRDLQKKINRVKSIASLIPTISSNYTYPVYSSLLGRQLFDLSKALLDQSNIINHIESISDRAYKRVVGNIMPSSKGKSEIKDCYIFEVLLELSSELRSQGFVDQIYFLTSNFHDFGSPSDQNTKINQDLNSVNAVYISNWQWLKSLIPNI